MLDNLDKLKAKSKKPSDIKEIQEEIEKLEKPEEITWNKLPETTQRKIAEEGWSRAQRAVGAKINPNKEDILEEIQQTGNQKQ